MAFCNYCGLCRRIKIVYRSKMGPEHMAWYLQAGGTPPKGAVDFQCWVHNLNNTSASKTRSSQFCPLAKLLTGQGGYCQDNKVLVGVHLTFKHTLAKEGMNRAIFRTPHIDCFSSLFNNEASSDVILKAGDTSFHAHKAVLSAHSAYFKAMFVSGMREAHGQQVCVDIDTPEDILEALLFFMYGKLEDVAEDAMLPLFKLADSHEVLVLRSMCLEAIVQSLSIDNVVEYLMFADSCSEPRLLEACKDYATSHREAVAKAQSMQTLMQSKPELAQILIVAMLAQGRAKPGA